MAPNAPGKSATTDQRLDYLTKLVESLVTQGAETRALLEETRSLLTLEKEKVTVLETSVSDIKKELRMLQETVNFREQNSRSLTIRLIGIASSEEELNAPDPDKYLAKKVYETILQPLLAGAKTMNFVKTVPSLTNTITKVTRQGRFNPKSSPSSPVIITLSDHLIKTAIFRAKKLHLPQPSAAEKAAGTKWYLLAEDLTAPNFNKLRELREHQKVDRAWTVEGRLRYTLTDDKDKLVHKLPSAYSDLSTIIK